MPCQIVRGRRLSIGRHNTSFDQLLSITPSPVLSGLIWVVIIIAVLYLARSTVHAAIHSAGGILHNAMRIGSRSIAQAEARLKERNKEVLLAAGREAKERIIEREFERVGDSVDKDLSKYPALRRRLNEAIARIDEDHQNAIDVPPSPPGWPKAVEVVAKIDAPSDYMIGNILADIHKSLLKAHTQAIDEYRKASAERHKILSGMMPQWIKIQHTLSAVTKNIDSLLKRSRAIDRHMKEYEDIVKGTDRAVQTLSSSSLVQFFVSALVLVVALGGATVNFSLIALPMAEMVGGTNFIGGWRFSMDNHGGADGYGLRAAICPRFRCHTAGNVRALNAYGYWRDRDRLAGHHCIVDAGPGQFLPVWREYPAKTLRPADHRAVVDRAHRGQETTRVGQSV